MCCTFITKIAIVSLYSSNRGFILSAAGCISPFLIHYCRFEVGMDAQFLATGQAVQHLRAYSTCCVVTQIARCNICSYAALPNLTSKFLAKCCSPNFTKISPKDKPPNIEFTILPQFSTSFLNGILNLPLRSPYLLHFLSVYRVFSPHWLEA